ncbi:Vancomycin B-type resistance protein VanW [Chondromyces apiculatus DSM 436]|uniref:Vancomycin B-type resistance protein VanW n=1 Tax=Chondromyces apiculatus DSM 436 TaxID=1192034 RepID=A0A017TGS9_9BACT|nr:Vancomycin B-type resistance protein VanW [Chondromyces apiculatus DSM 436]
MVGLCAGLGVGIGAGLHHVLPRSSLVQGLSIGERVVPSGASAAAWLQGRREGALGRKVWLRREGRWFGTTLGALGIGIDVEATLESARQVGHEGPLLRRVKQAARARRGALDVPLVWAMDEQKARAFLEAEVAPAVHRAPTDARLDMVHRVKVPDAPGEELDVDRTLGVLRAIAHQDEETVDVLVRHVSARVTLTDLTRVDVSQTLSTFETSFSLWGSGAGRAKNIARAASLLDGMVLAPGEAVSFNERVGPRTPENGFFVAPEILADETVTGYGGGTCQLASTLHAAALFGALDILDRQSHSRPSAYTKLGLDATVVYPRVDLKIRNSLPFPVMIHAFLPKPTVVRVELLGGAPAATVEYTYGVANSEDFMRRIYVKEHFPPGKRLRHQKGTRGYEVTSFVRIRYNDGRVDERHYFSGYRPAPEVYWVAPGYDLSELPPLPEHAKGVEDMAAAREASSDAVAL